MDNLQSLWEPPLNWKEIPDWDLPTSAHFEAVMIDERARFEAFMLLDIRPSDDEQEARIISALENWQAQNRRRDLGIEGAQSEWNALTMRQVHLLERLHQGKVVQLFGNDRRSMEVLVRRGLADYAGITERGRFVHLKGTGLETFET